MPTRSSSVDPDSYPSFNPPRLALAVHTLPLPSSVTNNNALPKIPYSVDKSISPSESAKSFSSLVDNSYSSREANVAARVAMKRMRVVGKRSRKPVFSSADQSRGSELFSRERRYGGEGDLS